MSTTTGAPDGAGRTLPPEAVAIKFPSGASGWFRPTKVSEENLLTEEALQRGHQTIDRLLQACWLGMDDPGPYKNMPDVVVGGDLDLKKMLQGDRFFYLVMLRAHSFRDGHEYQFRVKCPACEKMTDARVDLLRDLPVLTLPEESRRRLLAGANSFEFELPQSKRRVTFHLATGEDEARVALRGRKELNGKGSSAMLNQRIDSVSGLKCEPGMEDLYRRDWIEKEMTAWDADALRDEMDRVDCGLVTTVEARCEECDATFELDLPFGVSFLLPQRGKQARAKEAMRAARERSAKR